MRTYAASAPADALRILAELYRQARSMWPLAPESAGKTVTVRIDRITDRGHVSPPHPTSLGDTWQVRIDQLKDRRSVTGDGWLLVKRNEMEAVVEEHPVYTINAYADSGAVFRLLAFWRLDGSGGRLLDRSDIHELETIQVQVRQGGSPAPPEVA